MHRNSASRGYGNFMFQERFRNEGGKFFDANMKAQVNNAMGVKVLTEWRAENKFMPPGGHPELAAGFALSVASSSKKKELAYLFIQWLNSEETSMQRVQLPYALRDPFRDSHFTSKEYLAKWPDAKEYLAALQAGSKTGLLDLSLIQTDKYEEALRQGISRLWAGDDPKAILDDVAKSWDETTAKIGVDKQKAVYNAWAAKGGAYPK